MGLFTRRGRGADPGAGSDDEPPPDEPRPLVAQGLPLRDQDRALRDRCLAELAEMAVDLDSLAAISAAYDADLHEWSGTGGLGRRLGSAEHTPHVQRWGVAIGAHLDRHSDLRWATIADVFGTDLGLIAERDDFAVVPTNLVSGRWLNGERGWIPGVVGHLLRLRQR